eukprot:CAMPEP_0181184218 /NCGR_PEP_ID=MMETSP1096-20121128/8845_1 /TAXON_ID=156174 ORGANISM="Chrysochromulina ericina, Strain CCMP281" /NCGR_SAMPLE_ID=MMETSP1096 /ASSEMBLY_ACC=CAM_ASM_000453 /LENGTH=72 /DNA_ID=CAMNT_0023272957 /DNA_START=575 /DNA_END=793 /DNA_ORIENTATION=+
MEAWGEIGVADWCERAGSITVAAAKAAAKVIKRIPPWCALHIFAVRTGHVDRLDLPILLLLKVELDGFVLVK